MSSNVIPIDEKEFEQAVLRSDRPVLVDFWAPWCSPCLRMAPVFEAAAARHAGTTAFFKVNIDDNGVLIGRYGIQSVPTLILFKDGVDKERLIGTADGEEIAGLIERHAGAPLRSAGV
ncbi:MAG TPA: thioredoxin [Candidatus Binatia bacterium]|nr:thioredoxin [Candidatus Binatia bacterium]